MDATDLLERQHRHVLHQITHLPTGRRARLRNARLVALHDLIDSVVAHMTVTEALARVTLLRSPLPSEVVVANDATREALAHLAQSRSDDVLFARAARGLEAAFRTRAARIRGALLPRVTEAFDPHERELIGAWLAHMYVARRRSNLQ
jgi:acyl-CoA reductase-like NAD-dependent aldehyde dehydrogenase